MPRPRLKKEKKSLRERGYVSAMEAASALRRLADNFEAQSRNQPATMVKVVVNAWIAQDKSSDGPIDSERDARAGR